jgi:HK97 family phage portal protein
MNLTNLFSEAKQENVNKSPPIQTNQMNKEALINKASKANEKYDRATNSNSSTEINTYANSDIVYSCVNYIASVCSQVEFKVLEQKADNFIPVRDKKIQEWLNNPNPFYSMNDLVFLYVQSYLIFGNSFMTLEKIGNSYESWVLDASKVQIIPNPKKYIEGYTFDNTIAFKPEQVLFFKNLSFSDFYYGLSPLNSLKDYLDLESYSIQDLKDFYKNSSIANGILSSEFPLSQTQIESLRKQFHSLYGSGKTDRFGHLVLPNNMKYTPLKANPKDNLFLESMNISEERIYKLYNVPKQLLGVVDGSVDLTELKKVFVNNTIRPLLIRMLKSWENNFRRIFKNSTIKFEFDLSNIPEVSNIIDTKITAVKEALNSGIISPNEARDLLNLERIEDSELMDAIFSPAYLLGNEPINLVNGDRINMGVNESQNTE